MADGLDLKCQMCGFVGLEGDPDSYFYCERCGTQADGIRDTAVDNDWILTPECAKVMVRRQVGKLVQETLSYEDYYSITRERYVQGVQIMIQLQIKALVEKFKVCPIIVDMTVPVWLRFVASTMLFSDDLTHKAIKDAISQVQVKPARKKLKNSGNVEGVEDRAKPEDKPHKSLVKRYVMLCYRSFSKTIPLSYSLVISFLACHLAREPILSTNIIKWALEGNLPYFAAFVEIDKQIELVPESNTCSLSSSEMFRPIEVISIQKLESLAASIAQSIGLELPPVNFYAIASRYLKQLSLPIHIILPHACRIYEWSMPPELWLSINEFRLPTHALILSILIVSIRILYNIHGFGKWEMSLTCCSQSERRNNRREQSNLDATEILVLLQSKYNELIDTSDHAKDLKTYLDQYCKDVVFAGVESSLEDEVIKDLWEFYEEKGDHKPCESSCLRPSSPLKRPQDHSQSSTNKTKKSKDENVQITLKPKESYKDREIRRIKSNMEENKFCYIPPRKRVKIHDYLHYTRKKGDGAYVYAAHADYYILLRSCARVAQLDIRSMHVAVLSFERRLDWLEKNIQHSLKQMPCFEACELCHDDNSMDLSKLNL